MAKLSTDELLEAIGGLSLLEASELVKAMEDKFGISAAAPVAVAAAGAAPAAEAAEEQSEFDVVLKDFGANKIAVIKEVRAITGLGLKEAKELVEKGGAIKEKAGKDEANEIKEKLTAAGATIELS